MAKKRVGIISQARLGSSRLPGKVLLPLANKALLDWHVERLAWSEFPIHVATTTAPHDQELEQFCTDRGILCFRGDEEDVLDRFYHCASQFKLEVIVRVTSDCPLIDGELIAQGVRQYLDADDEHLFLSNTVRRSYPRGFDFEIFSFHALEQAHRLAEEALEREHVTPFLFLNRWGHTILKQIIRQPQRDNYRLTVDTPEDYALMKILFEEYSCGIKDCEEIIAVMDTHPEFAFMNAAVAQKPFQA